jgi:putative transposase
MPSGLHRYYGANHLHFIACSCYRRLPFFRSARSRARVQSGLEETRQRYRFVVVGYVVMPEHIHLLIDEPEVGTPSTVMQVLKQRTARALLSKAKSHDPRQKRVFERSPDRTPFCQTRFYDFNVWTNKKRAENLDYMHFNPVKRGLAVDPGDWRWSSDRFYRLDEPGLVRVNEGWAKISLPGRTAWKAKIPWVRAVCCPPSQRARRMGHPHPSHPPPPALSPVPEEEGLLRDWLGASGQAGHLDLA